MGEKGIGYREVKPEIFNIAEIRSELTRLLSLDNVYKYLSFLVTSSGDKDKNRVKKELAVLCSEILHYTDVILIPSLEELMGKKKAVHDYDEEDYIEIVDRNKAIESTINFYKNWDSSSLKNLVLEVNLWKDKFARALSSNFSSDCALVRDYINYQNSELKKFKELKEKVDRIFNIETSVVSGTKFERIRKLRRLLPRLNDCLKEKNIGLLVNYQEYVDYVNVRIEQVKAAIWATLQKTK